MLLPRRSDRIVTSVEELRVEMERPVVDVSLRLVGHFPLGSETPWRSTLLPGITRDPATGRRRRITLWSSDDDNKATLDAEGMGRIFRVAGGELLLQGLHITGGRTEAEGGGCVFLQVGKVTVRSSRFTNCTTGAQSGGALQSFDTSSMNIADSEFSDCSVINSSEEGFAAGGAINVAAGSEAIINRTTFTRTQALSHNNVAYGGAIAVFRTGTVVLDDVQLRNTCAESRGRAGAGLAWGGGLGMRGQGGSGRAQVYRSKWTATRALSLHDDAWGGGIGLQGTEIANVFDTRFSNCEARGHRDPTRAGSLGGVGGSVAAGVGGHVKERHTPSVQIPVHAVHRAPLNSLH